jgi:uncharacterized protein YggU (UPF0235/DUF167 family)
VASSQVRLLRGQTCRRKGITVEGFSAEEVPRALLKELPLATDETGQ